MNFTEINEERQFVRQTRWYINAGEGLNCVTSCWCVVTDMTAFEKPVSYEPDAGDARSHKGLEYVKINHDRDLNHAHKKGDDIGGQLHKRTFAVGI